MTTAVTAVTFVAVVVGLASLARRLGTSAPLLLMVAGIGLSFIPGLLEIRVSQDMILVGLLPPLLYAAAIRTSILDLKANTRSIVLLSVGLVAFTAVGVGLATRALLGIPMALAIAFGGVVAPPDAVAATAVAKRVGMPRRLVTILEGESLFNDATALVIVRTGLAALVVSQVSAGDVALQFGWATLAGVGIGLLVAWVVRRVRGWITRPVVDTALSFLCPWLAYLPAEEVHASGVLAVVVTGVVLGHKAPHFQSALSRTAERINWRTVSFVLENAVFLVIGLQAKSIVADVSTENWWHVVGVAAAVLGAVVALRFVWVFATLPLWRRGLGKGEAARAGLVVSWAGMRGVVTLAAVLAIPADAPQRPVLVLIALVVTAGTLVLQGYSLPWVTRLSGLRAESRRELDLERAELVDRVVAGGIARLDQAEEDAVPTHVDKALRGMSERRAHGAWERLETTTGLETPTAAYRRMRAEMLRGEREAWLAARDEGRFSSNVLDDVMGSMDLEESMIIVLGDSEAARRDDSSEPELVGRDAGSCEHLDAAGPGPGPQSEGCEECLRDGTEWVALRMCLTCGHVGCCDSSVGRHASRHYDETGHPVMQSVMPGESWRWCYVDQLLS